MRMVNGGIIRIPKDQDKLHAGVPVFRRLILEAVLKVERSMVDIVSIREEQDSPAGALSMPRLTSSRPPHHGTPPTSKTGPCSLLASDRYPSMCHVAYPSASTSKSGINGINLACIASAAPGQSRASEADGLLTVVSCGFWFWKLGIRFRLVKGICGGDDGDIRLVLYHVVLVDLHVASHILSCACISLQLLRVRCSVRDMERALTVSILAGLRGQVPRQSRRTRRRRGLREGYQQDGPRCSRRWMWRMRRSFMDRYVQKGQRRRNNEESSFA